jgi:hypothetical protein
MSLFNIKITKKASFLMNFLINNKQGKKELMIEESIVRNYNQE